MKFYLGENLGGNKYRVEARSDPPANMLMAIYDGYYNYKYNDFTLYRRFVGYNTLDTEVPGKCIVSGLEMHRQPDKPKVTKAGAPEDTAGPDKAEGASAKRIRRDTVCEGQLELRIE